MCERRRGLKSIRGGERDRKRGRGERDIGKKEGGKGRTMIQSPTEGEKLDTLIKKVERW